MAMAALMMGKISMAMAHWIPLIALARWVHKGLPVLRARKVNKGFLVREVLLDQWVQLAYKVCLG